MTWIDALFKFAISAMIFCGAIFCAVLTFVVIRTVWEEYQDEKAIRQIRKDAMEQSKQIRKKAKELEIESRRTAEESRNKSEEIQAE